MKNFNGDKIGFTLGLLLMVALSGCGHSDQDTVEVTVDIGVPIKAKPFHDLSHETFTQFVAPSNTCLQKYFFSGFKDNQNSFEQIERKPIKLYTTMSGTSWGSSEANAISGLQNGYLEEPVKMAVPKGQSIGIGIVGALYDPLTQTAGFCTTWNGVEVNSYPVIGHKDFTVTNASTVSIKLWTVYGKHDHSAIPLSCASGTNSQNGQNCAKKNFLQVKYITCSASPTVSPINVQYLLGGTQPPIMQVFDLASLVNSPYVTIPDFGTIKVIYSTGTNTFADVYTRGSGTIYDLASTNNGTNAGCFQVESL